MLGFSARNFSRANSRLGILISWSPLKTFQLWGRMRRSPTWMAPSPSPRPPVRRWYRLRWALTRATSSAGSKGLAM